MKTVGTSCERNFSYSFVQIIMKLCMHFLHGMRMFVCVEVLWPSQPNGVMSSVVSIPNHMFTGQA